MQTVVLVIHLMICAALVFVVLLQRSEGGALGIGGGGGGFMTGRGQANLLTRITAMLALAFFVSSISLSLIAHRAAPVPGSMMDKSEPASASAPATDAAPSNSTSTGTNAPATPPAAGAPSTTAPAQPHGGVLDKLD